LIEQVLHLSPDEVRSVASFLSWNLQEENSVYRYEFFRDNCASRVIVVLKSSLGDSFRANCEADGRTFRDGLGPYIDGSPWTSLGMDFALGPQADKIMPPCGALYIPDDLSKALLRMTINGEPLTTEDDKNELLIVEGSWFSGSPEGSMARNIPTAIMVILALTICLLRFKSRNVPASNPKIYSTLFIVFKGIILSLASLLGLLLLVMWIFTDHTDIWANWNLLWTLPATVYFIPNNSPLKATLTYTSVVLIASYLLLSPGILPQFTSISLWCAAISVFLAVYPIKINRL